jgi:methionyl-tRNA formyltransferase
MSASEHRALSGLRVVFFGMGGVFSRASLVALLRAGADLRAVIEPAPDHSTDAIAADGEPFARLEPSRWAGSGAGRRRLPLASGGTGQNMREIATVAGAPVYLIRQLSDARTIALLEALQPDALCVACFTRRLELALLGVPRLGALNAHPSLLPERRGPDPLFWTFHAGARQTGVTIHLMDAGLDTGPMLTQHAVSLEEGETEAALEARLARLAGDLLVDALDGLASGALAPKPQNEARASYQSWPQAADYAIDATWDARRAWIFARGTVGRDQPIILTARDGARFQLIEPLGYRPGATLDCPWRVDGERLELTMANGVFICRAEALD